MKKTIPLPPKNPTKLPLFSAHSLFSFSVPLVLNGCETSPTNGALEICGNIFGCHNVNNYLGK